MLRAMGPGSWGAGGCHRASPEIWMGLTTNITENLLRYQALLHALGDRLGDKT